MSRPIDFSKMEPGEAVARLEKAQAALYNLAKMQLKKLKEMQVTVETNATMNFRDGTIHATCAALDIIQGRLPDTNLRDLMGVKEPTCDEQLFV